MARATGKMKPLCFIDVNLAAGINHFLYGAVGLHDNVKARRFICPECNEPVKPIKTGKGEKAKNRFEHVKKPTTCKGHSSWHKV